MLLGCLFPTALRAQACESRIWHCREFESKVDSNGNGLRNNFGNSLLVNVSELLGNVPRIMSVVYEPSFTGWMS